MNITPVSAADISIVVQGAVSKETTPECLCSLRDVFPGAEIILSTWEGTDAAGLEFDKLVLSKDPGAQTGDESANIPNNVNRQIVSTKAGVALAERRYILKTRTDIRFYGSSFLSYFGKYDEVPPYLFKNRLIICDFYTRDPRASKVCFHPSDWLTFGNADDVKKYYLGLELQTVEDAEWFKHHKKQEKIYVTFLSRYTPEQHIFLSFLRRYRDIPFDYHCQYSREQQELSEKLMASCFTVLDYQEQLEIEFTKYFPNRVRERNTLLRHRRWKATYERYCLNVRSWGWRRYLIAAGTNEKLIALRALCARILSFLHLKEPMKRFFGLFGYGK